MCLLLIFFSFLCLIFLYLWFNFSKITLIIKISGSVKVRHYSKSSKIISYFSGKIFRVMFIKSLSAILPFYHVCSFKSIALSNKRFTHPDSSQLSPSYCYGTHFSTSTRMGKYAAHTYSPTCLKLVHFFLSGKFDWTNQNTTFLTEESELIDKIKSSKASSFN